MDEVHECLKGKGHHHSKHWQGFNHRELQHAPVNLCLKEHVVATFIYIYINVPVCRSVMLLTKFKKKFKVSATVLYFTKSSERRLY